MIFKPEKGGYPFWDFKSWCCKGLQGVLWERRPDE